MNHSSFSLPSLPPLRARLLNALITRALPVEFTADAGTDAAAPCVLDVNGEVAALEHPAPFAPAATLFLLTGDSLWKLECSSLEALALRPELAAWRAASEDGVPCGNQFSALPEALRLAVLERLFAPALDRLGRWVGCEAKFSAVPAQEPEWADPLPLKLALPGDESVYLRLFRADERAARFLLERLETLPLRRAPAVAPDTLAAAALSCPVEVGGMRLSPREAAALVPGDILLPERWTPETPRLILPGGAALVCRVDNGALSVQGRDAAQPPSHEPSDVNEVAMTEPVAEHAEVSEIPESVGGGEPLLDQGALAALELPVSFELAALNLRVEEVAALAPGYTFALGGDAASVPVFVRVGGRIAARGRLVDVGGMPGVQITALTPAEECSGADAGKAENTAEGN